LLRRLAGLVTSERRVRAFDDELESHLQLHVDDNVRAGMSPAEARRAAVLKLGGLTAAREAYRDRATVPVLANVARDVRFAVRLMAKHRAFTGAALAVLALVTAAAVGVCGLVDAALLRPLPYADADALVHVTGRIQLLERSALSYPDFVDLKRGTTTLGAFDAHTGGGYLWRTPEGLQPLRAARVSAGFFGTLGVSPMLGRGFRPDDDRPGAPHVVILAYATWQSRYGASPGVVGQTLNLDDTPHTVVGVLPRAFQFAPRGGAEVWTPLQPTGPCETRRSCHNLEVIARLKPGVTTDEARSELATLARQLEREYPDSNRGQGTSVMPLTEAIVGEVRPVLLVLLAGAALLVLTGCVNVAALLVVRAESRRREVAVRSALGATRVRLATQFAAEGALLAVAGGVLGTLLGIWAMQLLVGMVPADRLRQMPYLADVGVTPRVLAAAALVTLAAMAACTLVPMLRLARPATSDALAAGGRGSATTWRRVGGRLVAVELATAVVLLAGAGLLGKSLHSLLRVDLGFHPAGLVKLEIVLPRSPAAEPEAAARLARQVASELRAVPGVRSVGLTSVAPVSFNGNTDWIRIEGRPYSGDHIEVNQRDVSADYFRTIDARLVAGRHFADEEDATRPRVAIVNRTLALRYFPGENPIGQRIGDTSLSPQSLKEIVGVVDDIREGPLDAEIWPAVYYPFDQSPNTYFEAVVRSAPDAHALLPALHRAVRDARPDVATFGGLSMDDHITRSPAAHLRRSPAGLVGGFAAVALALAMVGLHGVVAYTVAQRTREIGVRMALGATPRAVYGLVLRQAGFVTAVGIGAGLALSVAAARSIRGLLFATSPWDAATLGTVALVLALAALLASWLPARRAAGVDPALALRVE
jgi:predicted permease